MASRRGSRRVAPSRAAPLHLFLIAVGLLFAQVPSLLHLLLVPHATCEHGDLVERSGWATPSRSSAQADLPGERAEGRQIAVSHGDGGGHDHCDALAVRHRVPEVGVSVAAASLLSIEPIVGGGERGETRPVPLLALAPKVSPPTA